MISHYHAGRHAGSIRVKSTPFPLLAVGTLILLLSVSPLLIRPGPATASPSELWLTTTVVVAGQVQLHDPWLTGAPDVNQWAKPMYYLWLDANDNPDDGPAGNGKGSIQGQMILDTGRLTFRWFGPDHTAGTADDTVLGPADQASPGRWLLPGGVGAWLGPKGDRIMMTLPLSLIGKPRSLEVAAMASPWTTTAVDNLDPDEGGRPWLVVAPARAEGAFYGADPAEDTDWPGDLAPDLSSNFDIVAIRTVISQESPIPPDRWLLATVAVAGGIQTDDPWVTGSMSYNEWAKPMYYIWLDDNGNAADGPQGNGQGPKSAQVSMDTGRLTLRWFGADRVWGTLDDMVYGPYGETSPGEWGDDWSVKAWQSDDGSMLSVRIPFALIGDPTSLDVGFMASPWTSSAVDVLGVETDPARAAAEAGSWLTVADTTTDQTLRWMDTRGDASLNWPALSPNRADNFDLLEAEVEVKGGMTPPPPEITIRLILEVAGEIQQYDPWVGPYYEGGGDFLPRYQILLYDEGCPVWDFETVVEKTYSASVTLDTNKLTFQWRGPDGAWGTGDDLALGPLDSLQPWGEWLHADGLQASVCWEHDELTVAFSSGLIGKPEKLRVFMLTAVAEDGRTDVYPLDALGLWDFSGFTSDNWITVDDATRLGEYEKADEIGAVIAICVPISSSAPDGQLPMVADNFDLVRGVVLMGGLGPGPGFSDVPADHAYVGAIDLMAQRGIISGYAQPDGSSLFKPDDPLLRAQFAKMICGTLGISVSEDMVAPFADLGLDDPENLYPHEYAAAAAASGITRGTKPGNFSPWANITRAQVVTMIVRAVQNLRPETLSSPPAGYCGTLGDYAPDHGENARIAEYNGLMGGLVGFGQRWDPWAQATRGETAQMLAHVLALLGT